MMATIYKSFLLKKIPIHRFSKDSSKSMTRDDRQRTFTFFFTFTILQAFPLYKAYKLGLGQVRKGS